MTVCPSLSVFSVAYLPSRKATAAYTDTQVNTKAHSFGQANRQFVSVSSAEASFDFVNDISGVYPVQESDGAATVCVRLTGGTLEREVVLVLSSADLSALAGSKPSRQLLL